MPLATSDAEASSGPNVYQETDASARTNTWHPFWLIFLFGTFVRLVAVAFAYHADLTSDAADYVIMARRLAAGDHFVPYWPPGVPLFLTPMVAMGASNGALRVSMLLFWGLAAWALFRLCRALRLAPSASVLILWACLLPSFIHQSIEPLTQLPAAALLLLALSAAVLCLQGAALKEFLLLGLSLGLLVLVRPSAGLLLLALPAIVLLRTRRWQPVLLAWLLAAACIGAWCAKAHQISGSWAINSANGKNLWYGNNPWTPDYRTWYFGSHAKPGTPEIARLPDFARAYVDLESGSPAVQSARFQAAATSYIRQHPGVFLLRTANRIRCYWGYDTFTAIDLRHAGKLWFLIGLALEALLYVAAIGAAGFYIVTAGRSFWRRGEVWLLLSSVLLYATPYWMSMSHPTYHFPVLLPVALLGAIAWGERAHDSNHRLRGWIGVALFLLIQVEWTIRSAHAAPL